MVLALGNLARSGEAGLKAHSYFRVRFLCFIVGAKLFDSV
jgi:hypothetical protein